MTIEELTTLEKLNNAFYQCAKASYWKESTQRYKVNLIMRNLELQDELRKGRYKVSPTNNFTLNERGKIRDIKAPAMRDRVVQKILNKEILIPQLSKALIYDNYASLKDRGTSFARKRIDVMLQRYINKYGTDGYILQIDIKKYFDNIDHATLKDMIHKQINEPKEVMDLIGYIIDISSDSEKGLNLGAESPQIFAVFYLSKIDSYIKTVKGMKFYGRYMDDMFIISNNKAELNQLLSEIKEKLSEIKLEINERKTHITTLKNGFTFMQIKYNIVDGKIIKRPTRAKIVRERRRLKRYKKKYDNGEMTEYDIHNCYKSWRNSLIKDCNACNRTIREMDRLYKNLFPNSEVYHKQTREELIREAFKDKEAIECLNTLLL